MTHLFNGDALAEACRPLALPGSFLVCRECLIDGPLLAPEGKTFRETRAEFIASDYEPGPAYHPYATEAFDRLLDLPSDSELHLWFEYDLFCQANLWYVLSLLDSRPEPVGKVYRVYPASRKQHDLWKGFGRMDEKALRDCFEKRFLLDAGTIRAGAAMWEAYSRQDFDRMRGLAASPVPGLSYLQEVVEAEIARKTKAHIEKVVQQLQAEGITGFANLFAAFSEREGIYGMGDTQFRRWTLDVRR